MKTIGFYACCGIGAAALVFIASAGPLTIIPALTVVAVALRTAVYLA